MANKTLTTSTEEISGSRITVLIKRQLGQALALASLLVIFAVFSFLKPVFYSWANISNILMATAVTGLLALGVTFVIITGGIDLSIGTAMTLIAVIVAKSVVNLHLPIWAGILLGMVVGGAVGAINGVLITALRLPPFIATLATMKAAQGLALIIPKMVPVGLYGVTGWSAIAQGNIIPNFPNGVLILFVSALIAAVILNKTILGRYTFAIGSNEEATRLSGVKVNRWLIVIYMLCGVFVGLGAVVLTARIGAAQPDLGLGYELEAIAAVIIGGTSLLGGKGTISGTVIGALIMAVLANGLRIIEVQQEWQYVVVGVVIIVAVWGDTARRRRAGDL